MKKLKSLIFVSLILLQVNAWSVGISDFSGLTLAQPVAHDKIEIEVQTLDGPGSFVYKLFVNNSDQPILLLPEALVLGHNGSLKYTLKSLKPDTDYTLRVAAEDTISGKQSSDEVILRGRTFDNKVADFMGVKTASLIPGKSSSEVQLSWTMPELSSPIMAGPYDPAYFEVTLISQVGGLENLNNDSYVGVDKVKFRYPSAPLTIGPGMEIEEALISGLLPDTTYYFQVRAIHHAYNNMVGAGNLDTEMNTRYLTVKTDAIPTVTNFDLTNVYAYTTIDKPFDVNTLWEPGNGSFDHYRVFYSMYLSNGDYYVDDQLVGASPSNFLFNLNASCPSKTLTEGCQIVSSRDNFLTLKGLNPYSRYQVKVAMCLDAACSLHGINAALISDMIPVSTIPFAIRDN